MAEATIHRARLRWSGGVEGAAMDYETFSRDYDLTFESGVVLPGSSAPSFKGDPTRVDPEAMLVGALSSCHMLTFLALMSRKRLPVLGYDDEAEGVLEQKDGKLRVTRVLLRPKIRLAQPVDAEVLARAQEKAHDHCFIANSVTCEVAIEPVYENA
ncbi:MAG: OsmC family protein [Myxococcales bacterium]|nr:OsmC family protein [Myxococcales bacterium]